MTISISKKDREWMMAVSDELARQAADTLFDAITRSLCQPHQRTYRVRCDWDGKVWLKYDSTDIHDRFASRPSGRWYCPDTGEVEPAPPIKFRRYRS